MGAHVLEPYPTTDNALGENHLANGACSFQRMTSATLTISKCRTDAGII